MNTNIPMMYQGLQLNDPVDTVGRAMSLRQMATQNQIMQSQMQQQQDQAALGQMRQKAFMESGGNPVKLRATLASMGDMEGVNALDEQQLKTRKGEADIASTQAGTQEKVAKLRSQAAIIGYMGGTMDHAKLAAQELRQGGDIQGADHLDALINQYPDATPDQIRAVFQPYISSQISPEKLLMPSYQGAGGALVNTNPLVNAAPIPMTQSPDSIASNKVAREGQAITRQGQIDADARAREAMASGKAPQGYRFKQDGSLEAIPGGPADASSKNAKLTDVQAKAQLYGTRAKAAHDILNNLEGKYSPLAVNAKMAASDTPLIGGVGGLIGNELLSESGQKAEQAQRDFVNAILRQESGAVISEPEFRNAQKQYFPQPGDTKGTLQQKRENRARAIQALDVMSGPAGGFSKGGIKFLGFE